MSFTTILGLGQTALELGLMSSLTVLALFLSYTMLNVCDLSTDGCFTLGAAVGAVVALAGHPFLSIPAAMLAGVISGFVTAFLQTRMGVNSLLAGIVVNTALYSINIAVMGNTSLLNMNKTETVFTKMQSALEGTFLAGQQKLAVSLIAVALVIVFLSLFLRTKLGLAIRATGNNPDMVKSSSIDPVFTTTVGLCVANAFTALSGCLLAQAQKSVNIDIGSGMVTIALASLLIGGMFFRRRGVALRAVGAVLGAFLFRLVYTLALRFDMPASMLKLVSSVIVVIAISGPYLKGQLPLLRRQLALANDLHLPVILHDREAHGPMLDLLREFRPAGVVHCFSGSVEMAREVLALGLYIGLGGATTFKNAVHPLEVAAMVPPDRLLLETDAPYMTPVPLRGKRNDSAKIAYTAEKIAAVRGVDPQTLCNETCQNACRLFGIDAEKLG